MHELGLSDVIQRIGAAINAGQVAQAEAMLWPALEQFPTLPQLWYHAGIIFFEHENMAMATIAFERALDLEPNAAGYGNLGAAYRRMGYTDQAINVLEKATEIEPKQANAWTNYAACFINEGCPEKGMDKIAKALAVAPEHARARWNASLLNLELGNFKTGFELYRSGLGADRLAKSYGDSCAYLTTELHDSLMATGERPRLIVYGEQGIGDELMFATILYDAREDYQITFDCHPRLEKIFRAAFPGMEIHPTRKDAEVEWYDGQPYNISIGDLGSLYRCFRNRFTQAWKKHGPFYPIDAFQGERDGFRVMLEALAEGRKIVGLTTRGGIIKTARHYRTIDMNLLDPLFKDERYYWVILDYEHVDVTVDQLVQRYGQRFGYFYAVNHHFDYDWTLSLVHATDAVLTVCQSLFHLSAASGHPTLCLVPDKPAWRYGLKGKRHYWYPGGHCRLFRQKDGAWDMQEVARQLEVATQ
jgi:tetratricopeptide (TPR) repeat protein